jgi:hypothetical protein
MRYRKTEDADIPVMARIRAEEWGTQDYRVTRISGYLECKVHPQQAGCLASVTLLSSRV